MSNYTKAIAVYVLDELSKSDTARKAGDYSLAFAYLENAHVLGQGSTYWHVKVHCLMLLWGIEQRSPKEVVGQIIRIVGAAALTTIKAVPKGNTGGSIVSPVSPMPIKPKHAKIIARARESS